MNIRDCMKTEVFSIPMTATVGEAAKVIAQRRIGTLPVVDDGGRLVGMVLLHDLVALVMPDFVRLVEVFDFVHGFGAVETHLPSPESLMQPVREIMRSPVSVEETCGLLRAAAILNQRNILDLPVVSDGGRLVGIASHVDIGVTLLSNWDDSSKGN